MHAYVFVYSWVHEEVRRVEYSRKRNHNQKDPSVCSAKGILRGLVGQEKTEASGRN